MRDDGIFDGDLVAVQRTRDARNGQVVVARIDGEVTIKRFEQTRAQIRLLPRNPDYAPIVVQPGSDFAIEGLYCGLVRSDCCPPWRPVPPCPASTPCCRRQPFGATDGRRRSRPAEHRPDTPPAPRCPPRARHAERRIREG